MTELVQRFPDPTELREAVAELRYLPGWVIKLGEDDEIRGQGCSGLTLSVYPDKPDSYHPERHVRTRFLYPVPAASFNRESWEEWLWGRIEETEGHERAEWFRFVETVPAEPQDLCVHCDHPATLHDGRNSSCADGRCSPHRFASKSVRTRDRRPFKPAHADGWDPGTVRTVVSETVTNTPNAGRLVTIPCGCGDQHPARMGEHFTVSTVFHCDGPHCDCPLNRETPDTQTAPEETP